MTTALAKFGDRPFPLALEPQQFDKPQLALQLFGPAAHMTPLIRKQTTTKTRPGFLRNTIEKTERFVPRNKAALFEEYSSRHAKLQETWNQTQKFLRAIVRFSTELKNIPSNEAERWVDEPARRLIAPPQETVSEQGLFHLAHLDGEPLHQKLREHLIGTALALGMHTLALLDRMREGQFIGGIQFSGQDACRYCFFQWEVAEAQVGQRRTSLATETDFRRSLKHRVQVRDAINARVEPYESQSEEAPRRIKNLLAHVPETWKPEVKIVTGDEIFRAVFEREVHAETRTESVPIPVQVQPRFNPDPCLIVGNYVLAGW